MLPLVLQGRDLKNRGGGDADYEDMDVFDDPPAGVASAVWHKKAGDPTGCIRHTDTSCEYENMDRTPGDLATGEGGGTPSIKPQGCLRIYRSQQR